MCFLTHRRFISIEWKNISHHCPCFFFFFIINLSIISRNLLDISRFRFSYCCETRLIPKKLGSFHPPASIVWIISYWIAPRFNDPSTFLLSTKKLDISSRNRRKRVFNDPPIHIMPRDSRWQRQFNLLWIVILGSR